jgi:hypothetical protein
LLASRSTAGEGQVTIKLFDDIKEAESIFVPVTLLNQIGVDYFI